MTKLQNGVGRRYGMYEYELRHYGVKGMKWGVRRSLTRSGRRKNRNISEDARVVKDLRKKKTSQLSNAELRKVNERIQLEQQYSRLNPNVAKKGMNFVKTSAAVMGTAMTLYNNSDKIVKLGRSVGNKIVDAAGNMIMRDLAKHL